MKRLFISIISVTVVFVALNVTLVQANLILNPSFETGLAGIWSNSNINQWSGWTVKEGSHCIDLNGSGAGWISQSFSTEQDKWYKVTFWMAGNPDNKAVSLRTMKVSAGNISNLVFTFDVTGHSGSNMGWTEESFLFKATGNTSTLKFESTTTYPNGSDYAWGPAIDLVNVELAPVPIPPSVWLLGTCLLGLFGLRKGFKKQG